jgi:hypothetical protein
MNDFLYGAIAMASAIVSLYYFKAWRQTRDTLFKLFALAFFLLTLERFVFKFGHVADERLPLVYCMRLLAFIAMVAGIVQKNLKKA